MKKTSNRTRKNRVEICFDDDELSYIDNTMKRAGIKNKSNYIRQMCIHGKVIYYDDLYLRKCFNELNKIGSLINQIARVANRSESIYARDIRLLKEKYSSLSLCLEEIFLKIEKLIKTAQNAGFETMTEQINKAVEKLHKEEYL